MNEAEATLIEFHLTKQEEINEFLSITAPLFVLLNNERRLDSALQVKIFQRSYPQSAEAAKSIKYVLRYQSDNRY